jgi:hypothetical protein
MEKLLNMKPSEKPKLTEKARALINWSELSEHLAHNRDSIRSTRIPEKYKEDVNLLISYIEAWLNCKELTTKESLVSELEFEVVEKIKQLSTELLKIGKNPFNIS